MKAITDYLLGQTSVRPRIGIICGSGLGGLATQVENAEVFEYSKIPNFPVSTGKQLSIHVMPAVLRTTAM